MTNEPLTVGPAAGQPAARILILEDSPFDADLAKRLLRRSGLSFESVVVDSMDGFSEQLDAFRPDVILSDFQLPGFTGDQALAVAQERHPEIPYIFWSGALGDETAVGLIKQGATDYILKDRPARLPSAIGRALEDVRQRARLVQIEEELSQAQVLAAAGHVRAAEQITERVRAELESARGQDGDGGPGDSGVDHAAAGAGDGATSEES